MRHIGKRPELAIIRRIVRKLTPADLAELRRRIESIDKKSA